MKKIQVVNTLLTFLLLLVSKFKAEVYQSELYTEKLSKDEEKHFVGYMGMTYDIILGNPYGDPQLVVDLGFKRYVLKESEPGESAVSFKSKEILCYYKKDPIVIRNIDDLNKEFTQYTFEPPYNIHPFNGSNYYKLINKRLNQGDVVIIYKNICSRYIVTLSDKYKEHIDPFFLKLLNEVSEFYQNIKSEKSKCDVHLYKRRRDDEECVKHIKPWISFFSLYGTHLVTGGYFGGEIINNLYAEDYSVFGHGLDLFKINLEKKRLNPFYKNDSNVYFGTITLKDKTIYLKEKHLRMYGGIDFSNQKGFERDSYYKWKESVEGKYAKPIRLLLTPFSDLIQSENGKTAYFEALEFYSNLTYFDYSSSTFKIDTTEKELYKMNIQQWTQITAKNENFNVILKCSSERENIISGFILTKVSTRSGSEMHLHLCPFGNECTSGINIQSDNNYEFGWALCTNRKMPSEMKQLKVKTKGNAELSCPPQMKIAFGFSFVVKTDVEHHVLLEPCKSNQKKCTSTKEVRDAQNLIWINCIPDDEEQFLQSIETKSLCKKVQLQEDASYSLNCPKGSFIISGFAVNFAPSDDEGHACSTGSSSCDLTVQVDKKNNNETHVPIIFIVCSSL